MLQTNEKLFSIGEVVNRLKNEYQKLTTSMIRFWEKEGLISPIRTPGGHRKYSTEDIKRMKVIAELRHKRYLPISVVRHIIERFDQDPNYDFRIFDDVFRPEKYDIHFHLLTKTQVARETELTINQVSEIEDMGYLPSQEIISQDRLYDEEETKVLHLIKDVLDLGFTLADLEFYIEDLKNHLRNERVFWKKVMSKYGTIKDRKKIYQKVLTNTGKIRSILYRKYGGLEIGKLLGDEQS